MRTGPPPLTQGGQAQCPVLRARGERRRVFCGRPKRPYGGGCSTRVGRDALIAPQITHAGGGRRSQEGVFSSFHAPFGTGFEAVPVRITFENRKRFFPALFSIATGTRSPDSFLFQPFHVEIPVREHGVHGFDGKILLFRRLVLAIEQIDPAIRNVIVVIHIPEERADIVVHDAMAEIRYRNYRIVPQSRISLKTGLCLLQPQKCMSVQKGW